MNIWDLLIPQTMENQRALARQRFSAGVQQPQMFQTDEVPIAQLAKDYEKGFGIPYPTRQPTAPMPTSPTAPDQTQNLATNMPIEMVQPRTAEDIAMRSAGIQGRSGAEKELSSLQYYGENMPRVEGFFQDVGEDPEDYDIPASVGGFKRPEVGTEPEQYGDKYWDEKTQSWMQRSTTTGKEYRVSGAPSEGSGGAGESPEEEEYKRALDTYKALNQRLDPLTVYMLQSIGGQALQDPGVQDRIKGKLTPMEQKQLEYSLQYIDWYRKRVRSQYGMGKIPSEQNEQDAATAENYLKQKGLRP